MRSMSQPDAKTLTSEQGIYFTHTPEGYDALVLTQLLRDVSNHGKCATLLHVTRDDRRLDTMEKALAFFAPNTRVVSLPAWDTVPYDRVSPNTDVVARRITALVRLALSIGKEPIIVLTTVNAVVQRLPPRMFVRQAMRQIAPGQRIDINRLLHRLQLGGYIRTGTVIEPGEFALRGGILDLFPPGRTNPVRLDFFGDTLESIKPFDPNTQRTNRLLQKLLILPVSEVAHSEEAIKNFRKKYVELFGGSTNNDLLYETVSAGQRYHGMENWLSLFHDRLETLFDYIGDANITFDHMANDSMCQRFEQITEHYESRLNSLEISAFGAPPYKPVPPQEMYIDQKEWNELLSSRQVAKFHPFSPPPPAPTRSSNTQVGRNFTPERQAPDTDLFGAVIGYLKVRLSKKKRTIIAAWTPGSRERLIKLIRERGFENLRAVDTFHDALKLPVKLVSVCTLVIERGFESPELCVVAEQDILGDRLIRNRRRRKKASDIITEATAMALGDLVVHSEHGIGRFDGLKTIEALGAAHDCVEIVYSGGDKLFLPVENIELLSRYGSNAQSAQLDKLGGSGWQARKSRLKRRLLEMAAELIKVAALREIRKAPILKVPDREYDELRARFPFEETEDQLSSIQATADDLASGKPMDRLVCGDVGFGKTEVALRSAFIAAMNGVQVAVVVPTTLLARQHFRTFSARFKGFPLNIGQASRLVGSKELNATKKGIADGSIDIVVGTHTLLSKSISFANLGLLIIDEEQHFGVAHKERLKHLKQDIHVLTLSATPIPRTLQLALSGVRELSLISTPPIDRLAVRTYISPFDPVILRDALRRERYRGGQSFYVAPRISDLDEMSEFLKEYVPELRVAQAHAQIPPSEIERIMNAFYDGEFDILMSTAIVESGLDVPNANTMIVHRADMFGLGQLYQLRGRVGRSKTRAYAYFTTPPGKKLTDMANKRLKVLQSLDTLGAGFSLASHDLDLRGGGNLLGEEQTGHIKEVGFELYQSMLEEAIQSLKGGEGEQVTDHWSPQISIGTTTLIPEQYVSDLQTRLTLYRRLSDLQTREQIDEFAEELVDRFGSLAPEVKSLLDVIEIKGYCQIAGITQLDAGPKGVAIRFRDDKFANPEGLIRFIQENVWHAKLQVDHKLVCTGNWEKNTDRVNAVRNIAKDLAKISSLDKLKI
ncbi:MAG: Transcription-repair-coupling factor [Hyphomicrobiaceae bacterium hypho_1]